MSGHGTYHFKNPVVRWLDTRLPIFSLMKSSVMDYPTPKNLNYFWTFGGILTFMLVVQILTGMKFIADINPVLVKFIKDRKPAFCQLIKTGFNKPCRTLGPGVHGVP